MEKVILKRGKRASEQQKSYLVDYLELHVDLAHDRLDCIDGGRNRELLWSDLAEQLNALGGANKDGQKWRKFWLDLKQYSKERNAQITDALSRSGVNGTKVPKPLTELEKRILVIMTPQAVDGDTGVQEFGVEPDIYEDVAYLDEDPGEVIQEPVPTTSRGVSRPAGHGEDCAPERNPASTPLDQGRVRRRRNITSAAQISAKSEKFLKIEETKIEIEEKIALKKKKIELDKERNNSLKDISNSLRQILDS